MLSSGNACYMLKITCQHGLHCMIVCQSNTSLRANGGSNRGVGLSGANGSRNDLAHHGKF